MNLRQGFVCGFLFCSLFWPFIGSHPALAQVPASTPPVPKTPEHVRKDRIECVLAAQEETGSTPTVYVLFQLGLDQNIGKNGEDIFRVIYRDLFLRAGLKPEWRKPAEEAIYTSVYQTCMRAKGYTRQKD